MKFIGLDGKSHKLTDYSIKKRSNASQLHNRAREIIKEFFPFETVLEEVTLPGTKTTRHSALYADFLIPSRKIMVEVHGEQHFKYNKFFHNSKMDFVMAQARDREKREWCELNNITLIELSYNESNDEWRNSFKS